MKLIQLFALVFSAFWWWSCSGTHTPPKTVVTPPAQASLTKPLCAEWGADWQAFDNFACQHSSGLFGARHQLPANDALTLRAKEQLVQDWFEDSFLRFAGYHIGAIPDFCAVDKHTACMEAIIQDDHGNLLFWLGASDGKTLKMVWRTQQKPTLKDLELL